MVRQHRVLVKMVSIMRPTVARIVSGIGELILHKPSTIITNTPNQIIVAHSRSTGDHRHGEVTHMIKANKDNNLPF